jgi:hypothetical protein
MSKLNLLAGVALTTIAVAFSATGSAYAHDGGMSRDGSSHLGDHPGWNQDKSQNQGKSQNPQTKLTNLDKTGKDRSIFQGLKQWEMKHERTKDLAEFVRVFAEFEKLAAAGQTNQQQLQALVNQANKLTAKFLANGGTLAEITAAEKIALAQ